MSEPQQQSDIPPNLVLFVPGNQFPDSQLRAELGIPNVMAYVEHTDNGPDLKPGWLLTRDGATYVSSQTDWLRVGSIWVGAMRPVSKPASVVRPKRPAKKRRPKKPSKAIEKIYKLIETEIRQEIAENLRQGA